MDGAGGEDARRPFCANALLGFQLDSPSRAMPMTPPAAVSISMAPVPLAKSQSAPAGFGINFPNENPLEPEAIAQTPWKCKGCPSTNQDDLEPNDDSAYTCIHCGTVEQQRLVSLARQGMCAPEDDGTWTGDARLRNSAQEAGEAVARGPETNDERRRRLLAGNGTRVAKSTARRFALGGAAGRLETQTCLGMSQHADQEDPAQAQKRHRIVEFLERDFDVLGKTLVDAVRRHVRMETKRILTNSALHTKGCTAHGCSLNLLRRPNYLIANCLLQECLERLKNDAHRITITAEYSTHTINEHLERMRELQEQGPSAGQVVQVTAAVRLLLDWSQERLQLSCCAQAPQLPVAAPTPLPSSPLASLPPLLALPPAALINATTTDALDSPHSSGSAPGSREDQHDLVYAVRDAVTGAAIRANVRADVRCAAMAAIAQQELGDYIRTRNVLPIDVLGVAVLASVASKLGLEDGTSELLAQCCHDHSISPTTAQVAIEAMGTVMTVEPAAASGVFGDGIF